MRRLGDRPEVLKDFGFWDHAVIQAHLTLPVKHPYTDLFKNAYMATIGERIVQRLAELKAEGRDISVQQIADAAGISRQAVYQWFKGDSKTLKGANLLAVAALLGVTERWLENGRSPKLRQGAPEPDGVPVVGSVRGGSDGYYVETEYPVGQGEGLVRYPTRDPNTYALRVKGDSMRPRIKPGEFIVIEPNHSVTVGEEVMVKTRDGKAMVKILSRRSGGEVELRSINEVDHPPFTLEEAQVETIHYIGAIVKPSWYYERS